VNQLTHELQRQVYFGAAVVSVVRVRKAAAGFAVYDLNRVDAISLSYVLNDDTVCGRIRMIVH
jgi:hypothetical protein